MYYKEAPNIIHYDHESLELKYDDFLMVKFGIYNSKTEMHNTNCKDLLWEAN